MTDCCLHPETLPLQAKTSDGAEKALLEALQHAGGLTDWDFIVDTLERFVADHQARMDPEAVRRAFVVCDSDGDGRIDAGELQRGLSKLLGRTVDKEKARRLLRAADGDGDGRTDGSPECCWTVV